MATTDIIHLQTLRSKDVLSGSSADINVARHFDGVSSPKLPTSEQLEFGDIALNIAPGYEVLSIKNYNGEIIYIPFNVGDRILSLEGLKEELINNFDSLSGDIVTFNEAVRAELSAYNDSVQSGINETLEGISATTLDLVHKELDGSISKLQSDVANFDIVQAAALSRFNLSLGFDRNGKYIPPTDEMSGTSSVNDALYYLHEYIGEVKDSVTDQVEFYDDKLATNIVLISQALKEHKDEVSAILNKTKEALNELNEAQSAFTSSVTESLESTKAEVIEYVDEKIESLSVVTSDNFTNVVAGLSKDIENLSGSVITKHDADIDGIKAVLSTVSASTSSAITEQIDAALADVRKTVEDGALVQAAALARYNKTLGFDKNGKYTYTSEFLSELDSQAELGIGEAIDAVDRKLDDELLEINRKYNQLAKDVNYAIEVQDEEIALQGEAIEVSQVGNESFKTEVSGIVESLSGTIENIFDTIDSKFEVYSGEINTYLEASEGKIDEISGYVETSIDGIVKDFTALKEEWDGFSGVSIDQYDTFVSGITQQLSDVDNRIEAVVKVAQNAMSGQIDDISARIAQDELVHAKAFGKLVSTLGLEPTGEFKSIHEEISGDTLGGAVDYVFGAIEEVSADTSNAIATFKEDIDNIDVRFADINKKIEEAQALADEIHTKLEEKLSIGVDALSAETDVKIESLSGELYSTIESLSAASTSDVDAVNEKVEALSAETVNTIESLSGQVTSLNDDFQSLSANTSEKYDEFTKNVNEQLSCVDEKIEEEAQKIQSNVEERLAQDELAHAKAFGKLVQSIGLTQQGDFESSREEFSGYTIGGAVDYVLGAYEEVEEKTTKAIEDFQNDIDTIYKSVKSTKKQAELIHEELNEKVSIGVDALSAATDEKLASLSDDVDTKIESLSESVDSKIESLSAASVSDLDEVKEELHESMSEFSGTIHTQVTEQLNEFSQNVETISGDVYNAIDSIDEISSEFSKTAEGVHEHMGEVENSLSGVNENVDALRQELADTEIVRAAAIAKINNSLGFYNGKYMPSGLIPEDIENLTEAVAYLSVQEDENEEKRDVQIIELEGKIEREIDEHKKDVAKSFEEVAEDIEDLYKFATDGHTEIIKQHTEEILALSAEVTSKEVVLKDEFQTALEETRAEVHNSIEEISGTVDTTREELTNDLNAFSGEVSERLSKQDENIDIISGDVIYNTAVLSGNIINLDEKTTTVDNTIKATIANDELVHAAAFARLNQQFGFNQKGQYQSDYDELTNRDNITGAIDYVYNYIQEIDEKVGDLRKTVDSVDTLHMRTVRYEELRRLCRAEALEVGQTYKITNYQVVLNSRYELIAKPRLTPQPSAANVNNGFYIIVKAISKGLLAEDAIAMEVNPNEEGSYFDECNIRAWDIKYDLFNDESRFDWANQNGFGVIYHMKDEFGNECPYDFKNIRFKSGGEYKYTFNNRLNNSDLSLGTHATNNVIKPAFHTDVQILNQIVLSSKEIHGNIFEGNNAEIALFDSVSITKRYYKTNENVSSASSSFVDEEGNPITVNMTATASGDVISVKNVMVYDQTMASQVGCIESTSSNNLSVHTNGAINLSGSTIRLDSQDLLWDERDADGTLLRTVNLNQKLLDNPTRLINLGNYITSGAQLPTLNAVFMFDSRITHSRSVYLHNVTGTPIDMDSWEPLATITLNWGYYTIFCCSHDYDYSPNGNGNIYIVYDNSSRFKCVFVDEANDGAGVPQQILQAFGEYENATSTTVGLMSAEDKKKLDSIDQLASLIGSALGKTLRYNNGTWSLT